MDEQSNKLLEIVANFQGMIFDLQHEIAIKDKTIFDLEKKLKADTLNVKADFEHQHTKLVQANRKIKALERKIESLELKNMEC